MHNAGSNMGVARDRQTYSRQCYLNKPRPLEAIPDGAVDRCGVKANDFDICGGAFNCSMRVPKAHTVSVAPKTDR